MAIDFTYGDAFLRDVLRATAQDLARCVMPGSALGVVVIEHVGHAFCRAAWDWLQRRKVKDQQQAIDALARISVNRARALAEDALDRPEFSAEKKAEWANYLSAVPMSARRAITRPNDGGNPTTLRSQIPRSRNDLLRFIPLRPPRFQPGHQVPGHDYRLQLLLGQGGFAEVWKADHILRTGRPPVALKFCLDPKLLVSLKTEIMLLDRLGAHKYPEDFVRLLETAYSADPPFLVYEYVDGGDVAGWLASFGSECPSTADVVRMLKMTARALAFAQKHGIVHRDLKPANVLVTGDGRIKIADYGIGAVMATAEAQSERGEVVTGATILHGAYTPLYVDHVWRPGEAPNPKVDVYACGVIAYQLLVGDVTRPIGPAWRADLEEHSVPTKVLNVIGACVTTRAKRIPDAGALLTELEKVDISESRDNAGAINYCIRCGVRIQPDDIFCTRCGYRVR